METGKCQNHLNPKVVIEVLRIIRDCGNQLPYKIEAEVAEFFPDFSEEEIEEVIEKAHKSIRASS